jgi:cardiolipin synthase
VAANELGAYELLERVLADNMMAEGAAGLARSLASEIFRLERSRDYVSVVTTGLGWLGGGAGAIERTLTELIETAERELVLAVYAMSPGPVRIWDALEQAIDGGISCTLIADRLESQARDVRERLRAMRDRHPATFKILDFVGETDHDHLHAKIAVADRRRALVGSANLTAYGMLLAHELAVRIDGPVAEEISARIDMLGRSRFVRPLR